jgi:tRNA pseudouridine38-40 synthase
MPYYKAIIEYNGTNYAGLQKQPNLKTIEDSLNKAISNFANSDITIKYAGRTDSGVHAKGQVISFLLPKNYNNYQICAGINFHLRENNEEIAILKINKTNKDFNPRFAAKEKTYEYQILNREIFSPLLSDYSWHIRKPLNIKAMQIASNFLIGKHDFSAFRASDCQADNPIRTLNNITIIKNQDILKIRISAPSFLYNMVRIISGTLVEIGLEKYEAEKIKEIMESKNRKNAGQTAPAKGLFLIKIKY